MGSKKSYLSYFNMKFFFKKFLEYKYIIILKITDIFLKLFHNNKMPTSAEPMEILKANEIRGYSHHTKSNLLIC